MTNPQTEHDAVCTFAPGFKPTCYRMAADGSFYEVPFDDEEELSK